MEIVSIEKKTFEEMKERFGCFSYAFFLSALWYIWIS